MIKSYRASCTIWICILYSGICSYFTHKTIPYMPNQTIKPSSFLPSRSAGIVSLLIALLVKLVKNLLILG